LKRPKFKPEAYIGGKALKPETLMMNYGYNPQWSEGAIKPPIFQTSTFVFKNAEDGEDFFKMAHGEKMSGPIRSPGLIYSRLNNPNLEIFEDRMTLWDEAEACAVFESGMAAITTVFFGFLNPGDVVLHSEPLYGGTDHLLNKVLAGYNIRSVGFRAGSSLHDIENIIRKENISENIKMIFIETPANPTNELVDMKACAEIARRFSTPEKKVSFCVDNTFLGPLWQHPLKHGADLVLYSATKYIGGHSDLVAGAVLGPGELIGRLKSLRMCFGNMASPLTCWLMTRSIETLKLRMTCQMKNARYVANFLRKHPKVKKVYYLGHIAPTDRQYNIYKDQCLSSGAMISFDIKGGKKEAFTFLNSLKLINLAVSLGGTESLVQHPGAMTHSGIAPQDRLRMGISDSMIRISVGLENPDDLILDIKQALDKVK